jgi:hypothetical protein
MSVGSIQLRVIEACLIGHIAQHIEKIREQITTVLEDQHFLMGQQGSRGREEEADQEQPDQDRHDGDEIQIDFSHT